MDQLVKKSQYQARNLFFGILRTMSCRHSSVCDVLSEDHVVHWNSALPPTARLVDQRLQAQYKSHMSKGSLEDRPRRKSRHWWTMLIQYVIPEKPCRV